MQQDSPTQVTVRTPSSVTSSVEFLRSSTKKVGDDYQKVERQTLYAETITGDSITAAECEAFCTRVLDRSRALHVAASTTETKPVTSPSHV